jgi:hypothetical protein
MEYERFALLVTLHTEAMARIAARVRGYQPC